ncbi:hypothetical protein BGZ98_004594 [Dissophora globulifera]|nr:hypothetical protein BGZ98_004594 [Dissophora globulifera]
MRAAGPRTYVALCKVYKMYCLLSARGDLTIQFQSLAHLLQIRACVTNTMAAYQELHDGHINHRDAKGWLYGNDSVDLNDDTLASSPIASPK